MNPVLYIDFNRQSAQRVVQLAVANQKEMEIFVCLKKPDQELLILLRAESSDVDKDSCFERELPFMSSLRMRLYMAFTSVLRRFYNLAWKRLVFAGFSVTL